MNNLKPCPFCGGAPVHHMDGPYHVIACHNCGAEHANEVKFRAEALWNRRVHPKRDEEITRLQAENERMRMVLDAAHLQDEFDQLNEQLRGKPTYAQRRRAAAAGSGCKNAGTGKDEPR